MALEQTTNQSHEKRVRLVRPSIVLLCGPAACGKSTFAQRHFRPTQVISSDWARGRVCDDERDQRFHTQAFALVRYLTELRLGLNRLCVVDSTALAPPHRREFLELAKRYQVPCVVFLFDVPLEKCIERDRLRERTVGSQVIERQYLAFAQTKADIRQEGFDQIIDLSDQDMDNVQIEIVFRPIPQPSATPGRRPQGEARPAPRPWQQRAARPPAAHEAGSPSRTQSSPPVAKLGAGPASATPPPSSPAKPAAGSTPPAQPPPSPAKPEARTPGGPSKPTAAAPAQGRVQTPPGAAPAAPVEPASPSQQGTNQPTPPDSKS